MAQTQDTYKKVGIPSLMDKFQYPNIMSVPKIDKCVLNTGIGKTVGQKTGEDGRKFIEEVSNHLSMIGGQKPAQTKAKQSIAGFKLREGTLSGMKITLRGPKMYDFLDRLINVAIPRQRDFRGIKISSIDGMGNLTIGLKEHIIFPEIDYDKVSKVRGMDIVIVTTANTDEEARELLTQIGMPFQK